MKKNDDWYAGEWKNGILTKVDLLKIIGTRLKRIRLDSGLNQNEFSSAFSTKNTTVSHWEHGVSSFDLETLYKLCRFFKVPADYFMSMDDRDDMERKIFGYVYAFCSDPIMKYLTFDFMKTVDEKKSDFINFSQEEVAQFTKTLASEITDPNSEKAQTFIEYTKAKYELYVENSITGIHEYLDELVRQSFTRGKEEGYQEGKEDGYEEGKKDGYEEGKEDGYREGNEDGYEEGKNDGYREGYKVGYLYGEYNESQKRERGCADGDDFG